LNAIAVIRGIIGDVSGMVRMSGTSQNGASPLCRTFKFLKKTNFLPHVTVGIVIHVQNLTLHVS